MNEIIIYWQDEKSLVLESDYGKIYINRKILGYIANMLAHEAGREYVWPIRLTLKERLTGMYFGRYK